MVRKYDTDPGYVTVPEANRIVLRMLRITNQKDKSHYKKILEKAKKGSFGGKKYKKRMYQVRKDDIIEYAKSLLKDDQLKLYDIEIADNLYKVDKLSHVPRIDNQTALKIKHYLNYLKRYNIISDEAFHNGTNNLLLLLKVNKIITD